MVYDEIKRIGNDYRTNENEEARKAYAQYILLVICEQPREEQSKLLKMWEWEIE